MSVPTERQRLALESKTVEIVRHSMIGFIRLDRENPNAPSTSLGSGTLVDVDGIRGVITAAHVVEALRREREVGILRLHASSQPEMMTVSPSTVEAIVMGGEGSGVAGPDIAFLRLPQSLEGVLRATNVFFSPAAYALARQSRGGPSKHPEARFVTGVLAEATRTLSPRNGNFRVEFSAFRAFGEFEDRRETPDGFDTFEFAFNYAPGSEMPARYGGLSGGGVWQTFEDTPPLHRQLTGMPFRETAADENGVRRLICHGPRTLYFKLLPEVLRRWNPVAYDAWADHR